MTTQDIKPGYKQSPLGLIPEDWEITTLGKLGKTYSGLSGKDKEDFGTGFPYIPYTNIFSGTTINESKFDYVKISQDENQNHVEKGDIFFTTSSETPDEVGMCSCYLGNEENLYLNSFSFGVHLNKKSDFTSLFLANFFRSNYGRKIIYKLAQGATRYNLSKEALLKEEFGIPSTEEEQEAIAKILGKVDETIEKTQNMIDKLELRNKGLQNRLLNNESYEKVKLSECLSYTPRAVKKPETKFFGLGVRSHGKGIFHKNDFDPEDIDIDVMYEVKENDLIVNITFAWEQAIAIAGKEDEGGLVSHRFPTYTFKTNKAIPEYFRYLILQKKIKYLLDLISPGGAGRNRVLSKKDFLKLEVSIPNVGEQKKIANILNKATEQLNLYKQKLEKLQELKKGLMQQLLTGKVRVKEFRN